jgi:single-stranded DNA-binding protein
MNIVGIMGKITTEPNIKAVGKSTVATFLISVRGAGSWSRGEGQATYGSFAVEAWGNNATTIQKFCKKGTIISISGSLKQDTWLDGSVSKEKVKISVNSFQFVSNDPEEFTSSKDVESTEGQDMFQDYLL